MAENLADRAQARLTAVTARRDATGAGLAGARIELDRRHATPDVLDPDDWATDLGATQHVATARAALAACRAEQSRIRQALSGVSNPADTATFQEQLRAALITEAGLRVRLREATERSAVASAALAEWSALAGRAETAAGAARAEAEAAARWQADADALRAALGKPPLTTLVADAAAVDRKPAGDRLAALLPDPLRKRALDRAAEARALATAEAEADAAATASRTAARTAAHPLAVAADRAGQDFQAALSALRRYIATAAADLAVARSALTGVAAHPDLTAAQKTALDPAKRAGGVAAVTAEEALSKAVADLGKAQRKVDDAITTALLAKPDADPLQATAVKKAIADRDAAAVQDPLTTARNGYDDVARDALDAWEVEVPETLWRAATDLATANRTLDRLADQAARDALRTAVDTTGDAWATALDARAEQARRELAVDTALASRAGIVAAASTDRTGQYVRGDGPGGRTPGQL
jgi:hypothetical protein